MKHTLTTGLALGLTLILTPIAGPALAQEKAGLNIVAPKRDFPSVRRSYQSMSKEYSRTGTWRSVRQINRVKIGSTKRQLIGAVGQPVSSHKDGSWDFIVGLKLPQRHRLICQYRVYFDDQGRITTTAWRRPQCADIVAGRG